VWLLYPFLSLVSVRSSPFSITESILSFFDPFVTPQPLQCRCEITCRVFCSPFRSSSFFLASLTPLPGSCFPPLNPALLFTSQFPLSRNHGLATPPVTSNLLFFLFNSRKFPFPFFANKVKRCVFFPFDTESFSFLKLPIVFFYD